MDSDKVWSKRFLRAFIGEFLATMILVTLGLSSMKSMAEENEPQAATLLLTALCFGMSVSTMICCFRHISGAHMNPAVTVSMVVYREITLPKAILYVAAQCLGSTAGTAILLAITPNTPGVPIGVTMVRHKAQCIGV